MTMANYLFYDLETSGLNPCFDQIYQFAAIRTDMELNPLEEIELEVRPTIDIIPSPMAMVTHQLPITDLLKGMSEADTVKKIHDIFNTPGTITLGYNTLSFDDEFLRFNFHRHLLAPYTHQYKDGCYRMDIYPMLVFYYLYRPDCLNWPEVNDKISLRLEHLSAHNQLADGQAHHAMVDVRATLALAHLLKKDEAMWQYLLGFFNKATEQERYQQLPDDEFSGARHKIGLMIDPKMGAGMRFQAPVLCLGQHRHYKNQMCWLRLDQDLTEATPENILERVWIVNKKWCETPFVIPLKERFIQYTSETANIFKENIEFFKKQPALFKMIQNHYLDYKHPLQPNTDVDAALYQLGFMNPMDEQLSKKFHAATPTAKAELKTKFTSIELQMIGERYLGRFYYDALNQKDKLKFQDYLTIVFACEDIQITDYKCKPKLLRIPAIKEIALLMQNETFTPEQQACLKSLDDYLKNLARRGITPNDVKAAIKWARK
jgi:exodeoxyribonuclease I